MEEFFHIADAHCHVGRGESVDLGEFREGAALCADACFPEDWETLEKFSALRVKKAYGIHPALSATPFDDVETAMRKIFSTSLPELEKYLSSADAAGETGLDERLSPRIPLEFQKKILEAQLELAAKFGLPTILHCVGEWGLLLDVVKNSAKTRGGKFLVHAAKCSPETAREFEKIGGSLSFGTRELMSARGAKCAASVAPDRILIESDSAFSAKKMAETVSKLAEIRNVDAQKLSEILYKNFGEFYSK